MPWGDRTGPLGLGPMTGRGAGYCAGYGVPGYLNPVGGRGFYGRGAGWWGRGAGRGWRHMYWATGLPGWARAGAYPTWGAAAYPYYPGQLSRDQEIELLKEHSEVLEKSLEDVRKRLSELESEEKK